MPAMSVTQTLALTIERAGRALSRSGHLPGAQELLDDQDEDRLLAAMET